MRWIIRSILSLVVLAVLAVAALFFVPADRIAQLAADRFTAATGRSMVISGDIRPSFWPVLGVSTGAVEIGNADWAGGGPMLRADRVQIGVDAAALVSGTVRVRQIELLAPVITLLRAADGQANWDLFGPGAPDDSPSASSAAPPQLSLDDVQITNATLHYTDQMSGAAYTLTGVDATLQLPDAEGPADLALTATLNGTKLDATLHIDRTAAFLSGALSELALEAKAGGNTASFTGRAGFGQRVAEGALDLRLPDLVAAFRLAALPAPDLPAGLGAPGLAGQVTLTPEGSLHLRATTLTLGPNRLTGEIDLLPGADRPRLNARLAAGQLDLSALIGGPAPAEPTTTGWSRAPIDVSALGSLDADVVLTADGVNLGMAVLGRTDLRLTLDRARAVTTLREIRAYEGVLTGEFVVNGRGGLSLGGDLALSDLALRPALSAFTDVDRLTGSGAGALKFLAVGNNMDALMRSLSGTGRMNLTGGEILGLDLAGMLRTLDLSYVGAGAKTIFNSIGGSFTLAGGVLSNSDLALEAPLVRADGRGTVDIGARRLDYRVTPVALAGADGSGGVRVPLLITGPWDAPKFGLDLEGAAAERLNIEREALEQRAKDALTREAERRGIVAQDGERLQDAARRTLEQQARERLEEEAAKGLRRLLGGN